MRKWPTMNFREYIRKYASETKGGQFFCKLCDNWVNKQRWLHFKVFHKYKKV